MYYVKNAPSLWSEEIGRELLEANINRATHYAAECIRNGQDAIKACNDAANRFSDTYDEYLAIWRRFECSGANYRAGFAHLIVTSV